MMFNLEMIGTDSKWKIPSAHHFKIVIGYLTEKLEVRFCFTLILILAAIILPFDNAT
jgi:hypothetical protein